MFWEAYHRRGCFFIISWFSLFQTNISLPLSLSHTHFLFRQKAVIWFVLKPNSSNKSLNHFEHNGWWIHTHRTTSSDDYGGVKGFPMATVVWGRDVIIQGDCGYTEVPCESRYSALHYHETEHMQTLYYPKEKGSSLYCITKTVLWWCSHAVFGYCSYLAGYLYEFH